MKRNPVVPFIVIMVFGIGLMFMLSFKGLSDSKQMAKEQENGGKTEESTENAAATPEDIYKQNCISCHGDAYQGGVGPALKGVGDRLSADEIKNTLTNGKGAMPPGLVQEDQLDGMTEFLQGLK
ncbi:cytochrome c550 [Peribacillus asahii]|uniref:Cytochrome C n=1 Tax=Peribacillus asahii TaxID=228899 RepID=A0A3Q9RQG7_9BACI|nr:cytochrome c [Peribacillus asahii]AZV44419.1 cytochrome C' [Peribacillus asahii]USK84111.1 cytochrome c [Peribacillus asahii]